MDALHADADLVPGLAAETPPSPVPLTPERIEELCQALDVDWGEFDPDIVREILDHHQEVFPVLSRRVIAFCEDYAASRRDCAAWPCLTLFLFEDRRWIPGAAALESICRLSEQLVYDVLGDGVSEDLPYHLTHLGDLPLLGGLMLDEQLNVWVRESAARACLWLVLQGEAPREQAVSLLREALRKELEWDQPEVYALETAYHALSCLALPEEMAEFDALEERIHEELESGIGNPILDASLPLEVRANIARSEWRLEHYSDFIDYLYAIQALEGSSDGWQDPNWDDEFDADLSDSYFTRAWSVLQGYDVPVADPEPDPYHAEQIFRGKPKIGRNDPCICGSGKKYKKCCGRG